MFTAQFLFCMYKCLELDCVAMFVYSSMTMMMRYFCI